MTKTLRAIDCVKEMSIIKSEINTCLNECGSLEVQKMHELHEYNWPVYDQINRDISERISKIKAANDELKQIVNQLKEMTEGE